MPAAVKDIHRIKSFYGTNNEEVERHVNEFLTANATRRILYFSALSGGLPGLFLAYSEAVSLSAVSVQQSSVF